MILYLKGGIKTLLNFLDVKNNEADIDSFKNYFLF
jgi:hypothetical protein